LDEPHWHASLPEYPIESQRAVAKRSGPLTDRIKRLGLDSPFLNPDRCNADKRLISTI
jgi:hypothetical protein